MTSATRRAPTTSEQEAYRRVADVVERTGLDRSTLERLWRAMGFAGLADDERFGWRTSRGRCLKDIGRVNLHVAGRRPGADEAPGQVEGLTERARQVGEQPMRSPLRDPVRDARVRDRG